MRKILLSAAVAVSLALASCAPSSPRFNVVSYATDYAEIEQATGVKISEMVSVPYEYESIGTVVAKVTSGEDKRQKVEQPSGKAIDGIYGTQDLRGVKYVGRFRFATLADAMMTAASRAAEMGANEIICVKYSYGEDTGLPYWQVTGMAIRRK